MRTCIREHQSAAPAHPARRGFTLVEMVVSLGVVALLCGILLPSLRATRESSSRLRCACNLRQQGIALSAYSDANNGRLPHTWAVDPANGLPSPGELMATRTATIHGGEWQGIGRLLPYLGDNCECMYCPSHHGSHALDRWSTAYASAANTRIYSNYHYSGHLMHWLPQGTPGRNSPTRLDAGRSLVVLTDGLRTQSDFNHGNGLNRLFGDLSVEWWLDRQDDPLRARLPASMSEGLEVQLNSETVRVAWNAISGIPEGQ
jgi:prepilin-type N-terminal cleavage/methylation domain-containing protein